MILFRYSKMLTVLASSGVKHTHTHHTSASPGAVRTHHNSLVMPLIRALIKRSRRPPKLHTWFAPHPQDPEKHADVLKCHDPGSV